MHEQTTKTSEELASLQRRCQILEQCAGRTVREIRDNHEVARGKQFRNLAQIRDLKEEKREEEFRKLVQIRDLKEEKREEAENADRMREQVTYKSAELERQKKDADRMREQVTHKSAELERQKKEADKARRNLELLHVRLDKHSKYTSDRISKLETELAAENIKSGTTAARAENARLDRECKSACDRESKLQTELAEEKKAARDLNISIQKQQDRLAQIREHQSTARILTPRRVMTLPSNNSATLNYATAAVGLSLAVGGYAGHLYRSSGRP